VFNRYLTFFYSFYISFFFKSFGSKVRINPRINSFKSLGSVSIGNNFRSMGILQLYADNGKILIGDNCSFNINVQIGASDGFINIGNDVLIGPNSVLRAATHKFDKINKSINSQGHQSGKIIIGNNVWISSNCVISTNVKIGDGCVIAAGSVVLNDTEPYHLYAGSPAIKKKSL